MLDRLMRGIVKRPRLKRFLTPWLRAYKNARVIKIDVEGAESRVVAGMGPLLTSGRKDLEVVLELRGGRAADEIIGIFSAAGFNAYTLENDYSAMGYLPPRAEKRPIRLRGPLGRLTDTVFSRLDSEVLQPGRRASALWT